MAERRLIMDNGLARGSISLGVVLFAILTMTGTTEANDKLRRAYERVKGVSAQSNKSSGRVVIHAEGESKYKGAKRYKSKHYVIHTKLSQKRVVPIGQHLDRMFVLYEQRFGGLMKGEMSEMVLYLFETERAYQTFLQSKGVITSNSGGMFVYKGNEQFLAAWIGDKPLRDVLSTLQHEGFHQFAWHYLGIELPVWMNEGLAQYFEDAVITGNELSTGLADAHRSRLVREMIAKGRIIPFAEMTRLDNDDWAVMLRTNADKANRLYAQAWSVAYFLIHADNGRYAKSLNRYLTMISRGEDGEEAFKKAFAVSWETLKWRWRVYAKELESHPVNTAVERMKYLAVALKHLHEQKHKIPKTVRELKKLLLRYQFEVTWTINGRKRTIKANDDSLYMYPYQGREEVFELLDASRNDLPPRIIAPGLDPEPMLTWSKGPGGKLVQEIEYK
ncbi:DUF1570 domain-containing protein [Poriferisphaera sp. WC338]|uniref:DUF1570 domain-containing protein n=1 Tax=Poriferisphaera sp. WC338 TaxID=3425129 RepID=UPI003D817410